MSPFVWTPFLVAPFLWPESVVSGQAVDLLFLATGLFAAAALWTPERSPGPDRADLVAWLFLVFYIAPLLIHLMLGDLRSSWHAWRQTLYLVAVWLTFRMCRGQALRQLESRAFVFVISGAAVLYVGYALLQAYDLRFFVGERLFPVWSEFSGRFAGPLMQPNWSGLFLALVTVILLFHADRQKYWQLRAPLLAIIPCSGLILTASRSAMLAFIFGCLLLLAVSHRKSAFVARTAVTVLPAVVLSMVVTVTAEADQSIVERVESGGGVYSRLAIWDMCWQLLQKHPLIGIGWGNLPAHAMDGLEAAYRAHPFFTTINLSPMAGGHAWAHNLPLQFAVEGGGFGILAVLVLMGAIVAKSAALIRREITVTPGRTSGALLGGILAIVVLIQGMLSVSIMQPFVQVLFALFLAALFPEREEGDA